MLIVVLFLGGVGAFFMREAASMFFLFFVLEVGLFVVIIIKRWRHVIRMIKNPNKTILTSELIPKVITATAGKIKTSSTSKTKKRTQIKKNRSEKGMRGSLLGVNPHSKGLDFSRSRGVFILSEEPNPTKRADKMTTSDNTQIKRFT